ncbi:MAG: hypothetical protein AB2814_09545 [Candidatus Sedimenticola endophacoides]
MNASLQHVRPACATEEQRFQDLMQAHHYLGALVKIGNTIRYVAEREGRRAGLLSISASALKCAARDQWTRVSLPRERFGDWDVPKSFTR